MTGATSGTGTTYPSGAPEFAPVFFTFLSGVCVFQCCQITRLHVFSSVLWCSLRFPRERCSVSL